MRDESAFARKIGFRQRGTILLLSFGIAAKTLEEIAKPKARLIALSQTAAIT